MKKAVGGLFGGIAGGATSIGLVSSSGAVAGTSAAGITSGLTALGGTMLGGLFVTASVPVLGVGLGYGLVKLITRD